MGSHFLFLPTFVFVMSYPSDFCGKRTAFATLGCKLNFSESSHMSRLLGEVGFQRVEPDEVADLYVVNTCSVTEEANKKCRSFIKRCIRKNPAAFVVVTGCYAQLEAQQVASIAGVDLVLGNNQKNDILVHLGALTKNAVPEICVGNILKDKIFCPSFSIGDRTRTFLKIQDGCDYFCSYCTIPLARGTSRSDTVANTVAEAQKAAALGAKEIILTGVNIGDFGRRNGETFLQLIEALENVEGVERYRISSIEPNLLTDDVIEHVAQSQKFMPHFHIPLQSGSDEVLRLMRRHYDTALFASKIARVRELIPDAFIGIDVIVGTNGETLDHFEQTCRFLSRIDFSQLHVFTYSERPNTQALRIEPVVPLPERHRRNAVLHQLSEERRLAFYQKNIGKEALVLCESSEHNGLMSGFTANYLKVEMPFCPQVVNTIQRVRLAQLAEDGQSIIASISDYSEDK